MFRSWGEFTRRKINEVVCRLKSNRALLGVDAGILIAFFTITMLVIYLATPVIMSTLFNIIIGGPEGIYSYLLELPLISTPSSGGGTLGQQLGVPITYVFGIMRTIALAMFAIVLIIAAICYVLENFRIMNEGTASNIIMNSVFTLILIFACQPVYNAVAGAINLFVGWPSVGGSGLLISSGNIIDVIVGYGTGGIGTIPLPNLDPFTGFFFSGILIMLVASLLMLTLVMGITRLFFVGVLAAVLPILLVLRLIPLTKHFADTLIQDLVGFMFASIMASIILLFGYQILITTSLSPLTQILIAIITLFAAAYMSTVFVGKFGALGMSAANMVGGAVSTATGAAMGMAGGALLGGGAGMASRLGGLAGKGLSKTEMLGQAGEGFVSGAVPGAVTGFLGGGGGGLVGGGRFGRGSVGMRGMGLTVTRSMNMQKGPAQDFLSNRAGSTLTASLYKNSSGDVLPTATPEASAFFMSELDKKSSEDVYNGYVANNYPELSENIQNPRAAGQEIKRHLQSLPSEVAYSNWQRAQNQGSLPKEGRMTFYQNARDEVGINRETVSAIQNGIHIPDLEALDNSPRFALDTFNTGTVTQKGSIANAKIFAGVKQLSATENQRVDTVAKRTFRTASPDDLGAQLALASGVKMTPKEQKTYGNAMAKIRNVVVKRNPTLANNVAYYTMGDGRNQFVPLMNDAQFTTHAVKDMESHNTSAWLANTLNIKQTHIPTTENLFKNQPNTSTTNASKNSTELLSTNQTVVYKQPKNKQIDLVELQQRACEEKKPW
ncbi:MAG: hypothetical protein FWB84_04845 [Candidatus Bathyarchaeota archaeon]|uniref:hypothetical protein n=1 Tax=Candidatus Bathycorpusculum sp. TaxID=2994959 RepID=UPI00281D5E52|nr:hypothetical protein [Candidatus Termiticorpusculum sp.]MCL2291989.1 hypothetical protein [Candidatus Termiticorpusculum sp.]